MLKRAQITNLNETTIPLFLKHKSASIFSNQLHDFLSLHHPVFQRAGDSAAAGAADEDGAAAAAAENLQPRDSTSVRLKSPTVASSEGQEEWETASESSQRAER